FVCRGKQLVHFPVYLCVGHANAGPIEIGAQGLENLPCASLLDLRGDKPGRIVFCRRAQFAEPLCRPKPNQFVASRFCLEFQRFVMSIFLFEGILALVESCHAIPHATVETRFYAACSVLANICASATLSKATLELEFFLCPVSNLC